MTNNNEFEVADLSQDQVSKVEKYEEQLRNEIGEEIVLIAYKNDHQRKR